MFSLVEENFMEWACSKGLSEKKGIIYRKASMSLGNCKQRPLLMDK